MKKILNILSLTVLVVAVATWLATGANRAWTKTSVQVKTLDPVTGIEGINAQDRAIQEVISRLNIEPSVKAVSWTKGERQAD